MFDLLHYGHIRLFDEMAAFAEVVVVGVLDDEVSKKLFGKVLSPIEDRLKVLSKINHINMVLVQSEIDPTNNIKNIYNDFNDYSITFFHSNDWVMFLFGDQLKNNGFNSKLTKYSHFYSNEKIKEIFNTSDISPSNIFLGSKGETLIKLKKILKLSFIEPLFLFYRKELTSFDLDDLNNKLDVLDAKKIIVRSSSSNEDGTLVSNAGKFLSVLELNNNANDVFNAIKGVFSSYDSFDEDDHVIVQRMTTDSMITGVLFTRDSRKSAPYYVINYTETSDTTVVTSGKESKRRIILNGYDKLETPWNILIDSIKEIESLFSELSLDVEFSINGVEEVIIHQVRPLVVAGRTKEKSVSLKLRLNDYLQSLPNQLYTVKGKFALSDMAFWNPSEIIGSNPSPLAYSLYKKLITDSAWNVGIAELGYKKVDKPLMYRIGNKPYIDLYSSFKALTPENLNNQLCKRLVDYYVEQIVKRPYLHDKIEFEIVLNSFDLLTEKKIANLPINVLSPSEKAVLSDELKSLTKQMIEGFGYQTELDYTVAKNFKIYMEEFNRKPASVLGIINLAKHIADSIAPVFSRQARYAFVSKSLLDSGKSEGLIDIESYNDFLASIKTVASEYIVDSRALFHSNLSKDIFIKKYGHLRAGTYDICKLPYSMLIDDIISSSDNFKTHIKALDEFNGEGLSKLILKLSEIFEITKNQEIYNFIKESISAREYFKFVYSIGVSSLLEKIYQFGFEYGFDRETLQYLTIDDFNLFLSSESSIETRDLIGSLTSGRKKNHQMDSRMILPEIAFSMDDFYSFDSYLARPNFITYRVVESELVILDGSPNNDLDGKIVVIENADPGFDWIFTFNISGLITKYGGVASHMSIRCSELGIVAAIGVGSILFDKITNANRVVINAKNQVIEVL